MYTCLRNSNVNDIRNLSMPGLGIEYYCGFLLQGQLIRTLYQYRKSENLSFNPNNVVRLAKKNLLIVKENALR